MWNMEESNVDLLTSYYQLAHNYLIYVTLTGIASYDTICTSGLGKPTIWAV